METKKSLCWHTSLDRCLKHLFHLLLQNDDGEELDPMMDESATDGFFVPDGQLSDDEGISSAQQEVDDLCANQLGLANCLASQS